MIGKGAILTVCTAEDLVVLKVFAGRERDWLDVEGIVFRQGEDLDEAAILEEVEPLLELKEAPEDMDGCERCCAADEPSSERCPAA